MWSIRNYCRLTLTLSSAPRAAAGCRTYDITSCKENPISSGLFLVFVCTQRRRVGLHAREQRAWYILTGLYRSLGIMLALDSAFGDTLRVASQGTKKDGIERNTSSFNFLALASHHTMHT